MKFGRRGKLGVSEGQIREIRALAEPLREIGGAKTAGMVAKLSDERLNAYLSMTRERGKRKAIKRMWELEEWLIGRS
jgi:hypothetical protein